MFPQLERLALLCGMTCICSSLYLFISAKRYVYEYTDITRKDDAFKKKAAADDDSAVQLLEGVAAELLSTSSDDELEPSRHIESWKSTSLSSSSSALKEKCFSYDTCV